LCTIVKRYFWAACKRVILYLGIDHLKLAYRDHLKLAYRDHLKLAYRDHLKLAYRDHLKLAYMTILFLGLA